MVAGDVASGRRGWYSCPFCGEIREIEADMIQHRSEGPCGEKRKQLREVRR